MDALSPRRTVSPEVSEPARAPAAGSAPPVLAGYATVRPLGAGGAGTVWLVREEATGCLFAAKVLRPGEGGEGVQDVLERARKEVRIAQARAHRHVLGVHRALVAEGSGEGTIAIVSDYAPGGSLGHLVRVRGRLPVGECVTVVAPIAQALAALHADGTAHGDVSPGNILFSVEGMPMLGDFGLGHMVGDQAAAGGGTPGFSDPAASAHSPGDSRSGPGAHDAAGPGTQPGLRPAALAAAGDVFSLGAVAWFILTGEPPAPTDQRPPLALMLPEVPAELAAAIEAALRDDPRQRPSADELARSVFRSARPASVDLAPAVDASVLPELPTRRREPAGRRRIRAGRRRRSEGRPRGAGSGGPRRWMLWSAAGALLAGTVVAGAWWIGVLGRADAMGQGHASGPGTTGQVQGASRGDARAGLPEALRRAADSSDPVQAVQALSDIRARAISAQDRELLGSVNAAGSEADAADTALLDRLAADGQRLEGFSARVLSAALESPGEAGAASGGPAAPGAEAAVVRVRIVTSGYVVMDSTGATVGERPAGLDQELKVVLAREGERWKVARIAEA